MKKSKALRLAGFAGALCVSGVLLATTISGTGAYFTDSHSGSLAGTAGHLQVTTGATDINFTGLIPGVDQHQTIAFTPTSGSPNEDIWMTFDTTTDAFKAFSGAGYAADGVTKLPVSGLGGFGHFKVVGGQGDPYNFESYNLQTATGNSGCYTDANGDGGSSAQATGPINGSDAAAECGVPGQILIAHNVPANVTGNAVLTFGLTGKATGQDVVWANVPFKIVATQLGHRPNDSNF